MPKPQISHTVPLDRAEDAFRLASDRKKAMKVQLAFHEALFALAKNAASFRSTVQKYLVGW